MKHVCLRTACGIFLASFLGGCGLFDYGWGTAAGSGGSYVRPVGLLRLVNEGTCTYTVLADEARTLSNFGPLEPGGSAEFYLGSGRHPEIEVSGPDGCLQTFFDVFITEDEPVTLTLDG